MAEHPAEQLAGRDPSDSAIARLIAWSADNPIIVLTLAAGLMLAGWLSLETTPLDAIPDLTDTQVIIRTEFPGQSPQIVEDLVTYPLSANLLGLPKTRDVRGSSMFGTSFVYVIFEDNVDLYWARSRVVEALSRLSAELPEGAKPQIGPDATGVGWVYQYALVDEGGRTDLAQLRSLQDWFLRFELAGVDGVAEVASVGGFVREYQVLIDPNKLRAYDVSIRRISEAVGAASSEVGGRVLEQGESEFVIRSSGYVEDRLDLEQVVVYAEDGTPVTLADVSRNRGGPGVAARHRGPERRGRDRRRDRRHARRGKRAGRDTPGKGKAGRPCSAGCPKASASSRPMTAPRSSKGTVSYLNRKLIEEGIAVALVIFIFLLHVRSAFVALITLPLGVLGAFVIMSAQGITANIMSLGGIAIAIGTMVDASIVMVENANRRLSDLNAGADHEARRRVVVQAVREVGPGVFFSLLIITVSFLPVFALTGESHRLFAPLAYTKTYAMGFRGLAVGDASASADPAAPEGASAGPQSRQRNCRATLRSLPARGAAVQVDHGDGGGRVDRERRDPVLAPGIGIHAALVRRRTAVYADYAAGRFLHEDPRSPWPDQPGNRGGAGGRKRFSERPAGRTQPPTRRR